MIQVSYVTFLMLFRTSGFLQHGLVCVLKQKEPSRNALPHSAWILYGHFMWPYHNKQAECLRPLTKLVFILLCSVWATPLTPTKLLFSVGLSSSELHRTYHPPDSLVWERGHAFVSFFWQSNRHKCYRQKGLYNTRGLSKSSTVHHNHVIFLMLLCQRCAVL